MVRFIKRPSHPLQQLSCMATCSRPLCHLFPVPCRSRTILPLLSTAFAQDVDAILFSGCTKKGTGMDDLQIGATKTTFASLPTLSPFSSESSELTTLPHHLRRQPSGQASDGSAPVLAPSSQNDATTTPWNAKLSDSQNARITAFAALPANDHGPRPQSSSEDVDLAAALTLVRMASVADSTPGKRKPATTKSPVKRSRRLRTTEPTPSFLDPSTTNTTTTQGQTRAPRSKRQRRSTPAAIASSVATKQQALPALPAVGPPPLPFALVAAFAPAFNKPVVVYPPCNLMLPSHPPLEVTTVPPLRTSGVPLPHPSLESSRCRPPSFTVETGAGSARTLLTVARRSLIPGMNGDAVIPGMRVREGANHIRASLVSVAT
jgi:hypothetical protein